MEKELLERFDSAVVDMNNFATGEYELPEAIELSEDLEICGVDLDTDGVVLVTPKKRIWGRAYISHKFRFSTADLSDTILLWLCEALEKAVHEAAAWWDVEE